MINVTGIPFEDSFLPIPNNIESTNTTEHLYRLRLNQTVGVKSLIFTIETDGAQSYYNSYHTFECAVYITSNYCKGIFYFATCEATQYPAYPDYVKVTIDGPNNPFRPKVNITSIIGLEEYPGVDPILYDTERMRSPFGVAIKRILNPNGWMFVDGVFGTYRIYPISGTAKNATYLMPLLRNTQEIYYFNTTFSLISTYSLLVEEISNNYFSSQVANVVSTRKTFNINLDRYLAEDIVVSFSYIPKILNVNYKFPFGIESGNLVNAVHKSTHQLGATSGMVKTTNILFPSLYANPGAFDLTYYINESIPILLDVSITSIDRYTKKIRIKANAVNGIYAIYLSTYAPPTFLESVKEGIPNKSPAYSNVIQEADLIEGTVYNGVFEKTFTFPYSSDNFFSSILLFDRYLNEFRYITRSNLYVPNTIVYLSPQDKLVGLNLAPNNITSVYYDNNDIDTTNKVTKNVMYITVSAPDHSLVLKVSFIFGDIQMPENINRFESGWHSSCLAPWSTTKYAYSCEFELPKNLCGGYIYYEIDSVTPITSIDMESRIGPGLRVFSNDCDQLGPVVTAVAASTTRYTMTDPSVNFKIAWTLTIQDTLNGFDSGMIEVVSDYDNLARIYTLDQSSRVSGDQFSGTYPIELSIVGKTCARVQVYTIRSISLKDTGGNWLNSSTGSLDPFFMIKTTQEFTNINITVDCLANTLDTEPPKLLDLVVSHDLVDVGRWNRTITVNYTVEDTGSGISMRHSPYVHLIGLIAQQQFK
eukprot:gene9176-10767_t